MIRLEKEEHLLTNFMNKDKVSFIYFYTPMCGTCHLAKRFLQIVEKMDNVPTIYEADINYFKVIAKEWEIESVPCFIAFRESKVVDKMYAFESVTKVYEFIQQNKP